MQSSNQHLESALQEAISVRNAKDQAKLVKKGKNFSLSQMKYREHEIKLNIIEGTIPVNIDKAVKYYATNFEGQLKNRDMLDSIKIVENIDENTFIKVVRIKSKLVVSGRETITQQQTRRLSENEVIIFNINVNSHPNVPINKDLVRAETVIFANFFRKVSENETHIISLVLNDPKGSVPTSLINSMAEKQLEAFEKDIESIQKS